MRTTRVKGVHVSRTNEPGIARRTFRTSAQDQDRPLGDFLARRCPEAPVGFLNRLLRKGFVLLDGEAASARTRLRPGRRVVLSLPKGAFLVAPNPKVPFKIIHEDAHLIVVDKPAGVVSEPGIGHKLDTLLNGLIARYGEALDRLGPRCDFGMVHRLDRDASGLLVVARQAGVQRALSDAFRRRRVAKRYLALLVGELPRDSGVIRLPLGRIRRRGRAVGLVGTAGTQAAATEYRVLERFEDAVVVEATTHTGRWRQLRLHFRAIGHPIAGDAEEGDSAANAALKKRCGLSRMFLHAGYLCFRHPETGRRMAFSSPLPEPLQRVTDKLRHSLDTLESSLRRGL